MLQKLWTSFRLVEFSFYELLVANRSTLNDLTGTHVTYHLTTWTPPIFLCEDETSLENGVRVH